MKQLKQKTNEMAEKLTTLGYLKYKSKNIAFRIKNRIYNQFDKGLIIND